MSQVLVKATRMGYYDHKRWRKDVEFFMESEDAAKCSWVEVLEEQPRTKAKKQAQSVGSPLGGIRAPVSNPVSPQNQEVI